MATKPEKWHADLREYLTPRLLKALNDDRTGRIPLRPAQRRELWKVLLIVMTHGEIEKAIDRTKPRKAARRQSPASRKSKRARRR